MLAIQLKKLTITQKLIKLKKKITTGHDHDKYITNQEFNKLTSEICSARLAQANIASQSDIANFVKTTDFDDKLKHLNKNATSNKTKSVVVKNELNELLQKFKAILAKGLTKDLINKYSILNGTFEVFLFRNITKLFCIYTS